MRSTGTKKSILVYCIAVLGLLITGLWFGIGMNQAEAKVAAVSPGGATFPGTGTGAIPDRGVTGCGESAGPARDVTFAVTGLGGAPSAVSLDMNVTHSWVGDLNVSLIAPDATEFIIYKGTGATSATSCGDSSNLGGVYGFSDAAAGDWWAEAAAQSGAVILTPGAYRSSADGRLGGGGTQTSINDAFNGVADPNGTWTLRLTDSGGGDTGSIAAANLTITSAAAPSGPTDNDFDGDGTTDFNIVRDVTPALQGTSPMLQAGSVRERMRIQAEMSGKGRTGGENLGNDPGTNILWATSNSGGGSALSLFGEPQTDFLVPADFDGDGRADIAVWRGLGASGPGGAFFYIFESNTSTLRTVDFGVEFDNPTVSGDYDADGKADPAVFRCPAVAGQCNFYYLGSNNNPGGNISAVAWGNGTSQTVFPAPGDYDGDGKYDFNVQITDPNVMGGGLFVLLRSGDSGVEYIPWGRNTDLIVPGDYDGDGKYDIAVARSQSGQRAWYALLSGGGTQSALWGLSTDRVTPGDFDGDGKTDLAVFRPDPNPDNNIWYVYQSGTGTVLGYEWGQNGDYPTPNWRVQ